MPTNGEMRFRLNSRHDRSAYIRTVTSATAAGWQNAHFHEVLRETYIVERGWIGYAEIRDGTALFRRCEPGEVFTTSPGVVHNIYMSADSVIHTVKHAGGSLTADAPTDWLTGTAECEQLRVLTQGDFPEAVTGSATSRASTATPSRARAARPQYGDDYRHFDSLVWQVPAWASALFTAVLVSVNSFLTPGDGRTPDTAALSDNLVAQLFGLTSGTFAAVQLLLFGGFSLILAYALYRFRWHQAGTRAWRASVLGLRFSPQAWLQYMVNVQTGLMLFIGAAMAGVPRAAAGALAVGVMGFCTWYWDRQILHYSEAMAAHSEPLDRAAEEAVLRGAS